MIFYVNQTLLRCHLAVVSASRVGLNQFQEGLPVERKSRKGSNKEYVILVDLGTRLFVKVPREGDSEGTFSVFETSCHLSLPVKPSKVEAIPLSALPKDTTSELADLSPH